MFLFIQTVGCEEELCLWICHSLPLVTQTNTRSKLNSLEAASSVSTQLKPVSHASKICLS